MTRKIFTTTPASDDIAGSDVVLDVPEEVTEDKKKARGKAVASEPAEPAVPEIPDIPQDAALPSPAPEHGLHSGPLPDESAPAPAGEHPAPGDHDRALRLIESIENDLRVLRQLVTGSSTPRVDHALSVASAPVGFMQHGHDAGIDGTFDGERMVDAEGKGYQVPPNYASKSKLVEGDPLKLYITRDGKYVYKQLGPVERTTIPGTLRQEGNHYVIDADDGKTYNVLTACVTYYMSLYGLEPNGRVMALLPAGREARWAVIDNVL